MANDKPKGFGIGAYNVPRDTDKPPPQPPPTDNRGFKLDIDTQPFQDFLGRVRDNFVPAFRAQQLGAGGGQGSFAPPLGGGFSGLGTAATNSSSTPLTAAEKLAQQRAFQNSGRADQNQSYDNKALNSAEDPFAAFLAQFADQNNGGTGSAGPDYSAYRASLTDQAQQINAQIQAMYNQLGESAGENVARLEDIYGGAQTGIGDVYGSAAANTADAYGSSQQQAADQLARLGIEAAAPAVVNPMALSQAEALSGLEAGKAGGQAAAERYGATAGGFGSQMAQVAQQQGTEMNAAVLNALQNRLNETLLMEEQGRQAAASGGGGADPMDSAMQYLKLQEMFNAPAVAQQEMQFKAAQIAADNTLSQQNKLVTLWADIRNDYDSDEEAWQAAQTAIEQAQAAF